MACFIASRSDIDDVIPILTAYQIEWNKIHDRIKRFLAANLDFKLSLLPTDPIARQNIGLCG